MSSQHTEGPSPGVAAFIGFIVQAKPLRFESAGASALRTVTFSFNPGDATDMSLIVRGALTKFCSSVGAQSTAQPTDTSQATRIKETMP